MDKIQNQSHSEAQHKTNLPLAVKHMHNLEAFDLLEWVTEALPCNMLHTEMIWLWGHDTEHWHIL